VVIAVVQRVVEAAVTVESEGYAAGIGRGLCVLLAVEKTDCEGDADWIARKLARLRVFPDLEHRMARSVQDVGGEILLVSQFTLVGDCRKGNRPGFGTAASPEQGRILINRVADQLRQEHDLTVACGVFGAMMQVNIINDGPVTLILRHP
jgi:D-tyrosyl-tRNA(Tyr) deacylase